MPKLIIFSKAPEAGKVKTRLIPQLGQHKATQLHQYMLKQTLINASKLHDIHCELHCAGDISHPVLQELSHQYKLPLCQQLGKSLGERMANAMQTALQTETACVIIGTDCPALSSDYINQAFDHLNNNDVVIGPAQDGGYVLIGSKLANREIFNNIEWSSAKVFDQTVKNILQLQLKYYKMNTLSDIDEHIDLNHLSESYLNQAFLETTL